MNATEAVNSFSQINCCIELIFNLLVQDVKKTEMDLLRNHVYKLSFTADELSR